MARLVRVIFLSAIILFLAFAGYFFIGKAPEQKSISWGVTFSQMQSEDLGLDWKENYSAILKDLGVKKIKLHTNWNLIEDKKGVFNFKDTDWQLQQAKNYGANVIYVVGMKTGRWPECHLPEWAKSISKEEQQEAILKYIREVVLKYKDSQSIIYWQAENEPFFKFGDCPWYDKYFLEKEVNLIKSLDPSRQVIVSDSGELSNWVDAANVGDIIGTTMYRKVWSHITDKYGFYWTSFFTPVSYWRKAQIIDKLFNKKVICIELQAEPWTPRVGLNKASLEEQEKTMNLNQFRKNIEFAKKTGLDTFYFWGAEWWYWMKEKHNKPEIWDEAKNLFNY